MKRLPWNVMSAVLTLVPLSSCSNPGPDTVDVVIADRVTSGLDTPTPDPDGVGVAGDAEATTETPTADGCPAAHPWIALPMSYSQFDCELPHGTVCSWPAENCASGTKPDNVCTCTEHTGGKLRFDCQTPFHNCLPLKGVEENPGGLRWRMLPTNRPEAAPCTPVVTPRPDMVCAPSASPSGNPEPECATDEDCGDGVLCLDSYFLGGETLCQCHTSDCIADDDCGDGALCLCGAVANGEETPCGGFWHLPCGHHCLPSTCRTDADCGKGGYCSPSLDQCGWMPLSYHCHHPEDPECLTDWECFDDLCHYVDGQGWGCKQMPVCD